MNKLRILLSNDDGVFAEGINTLAAVLSDIADITIVAPDRNRSGASNSLTLESPLRVRQIETNIHSAFTVNELLGACYGNLAKSSIKRFLM